MLDNDGIFNLWQKAKEYALEIANSEKPVLLFDSTMTGIIKKNPDYKVFIIMFICSMCLISDNKILNLLGTSRNGVYIKLKYWHDRHLSEVYEVIFDRILDGSIKRDYDYSLPDGGIKDETITKTITKTKTETKTDGTKTITKTQTDETKTDETITKTKTETETEENSVDVILQNYKSFNNVDFISAMRKAIEIGWIEIKDGKCEWIGPTRKGTKKIKGSSNAALVYFIGKASNFKTDVERSQDPATGKMKNQLTEDSKKDADDKFPRTEIELLFGKKYFFCEWRQIFTADKKQVWREVIDEFFDENKTKY